MSGGPRPGSVVMPRSTRWDNLSVLTTRIRPDGYGIWTEHGRRVPFYFEYDTGSEPLATLIDKIDRYHQLWTGKQRRSPALFHLPSARRELNLHQRLGGEYKPGVLPIATCPADLLATTGLSPAQQVWWIYGVEGGRRRLVQLPGAHPVPDPDTDSTPASGFAVGAEP